MASSKHRTTHVVARAALVVCPHFILAACVAEAGGPEDEVGFLAEELRETCVESDDPSWTETISLGCPASSIPATDTECRYFLNTIVTGGLGDRYLTVSPGFVNVPVTTNRTITITLLPGGSSGKFVTVQRTLQNCGHFPCPAPAVLGIVNVVPAGSGLCRDGGGPGCNPLAPESCNGVDDDCDRRIDESIASSSCGESTGECSLGVRTCDGGAWVCSGGVGPRSETCDDRDNDCDGSVDEGVSRGCGVTNVGECTLGRETCSRGVFSGCTAVMPEAERCDNSDDDCDGIVDEDLVDPAVYRSDLHCGACNIHCAVEENCVDAVCELDPDYPDCPPDRPDCHPM